MNHLPVADIDCHMVDGSRAVRIKYQIAGFQIGYADLRAFLGLRTGMMAQVHAELLKYTQYESGTVRSLGEACTAP